MKDEKQKINALMILEIIGKPQNYLVETLDKIIKLMENEPGLVIKNKSIKEPKKIEENSGVAKPTKEGVKIEEHNDFYVSFAEIEVEVDTLMNFLSLMFKYMPAHVEIFDPSNFTFTNLDLKEIVNDLIRRLHSYDEVARVLQVEKAILESKLRAIMEPKEEEKKRLNPRKRKNDFY